VTGTAAQSKGAVRPRRPFVAGSFKESSRTDLVAEAELYLATVELFRIEGCEPDWWPEPELRLQLN
jgi:hypothetical protein